VFQISIWGGLELCLGEVSPPMPPRGNGTVGYTTYASLYCSHAMQIKEILMSLRKITLPNGNHITLPKETKSKSVYPSKWSFIS